MFFLSNTICKNVCYSDGNMDEEEFRSFLHPEEYEHMKEIVILETLDDIDKNKDGKVF